MCLTDGKVLSARNNELGQCMCRSYWTLLPQSPSTGNGQQVLGYTEYYNEVWLQERIESKVRVCDGANCSTDECVVPAMMK